MSKSTELETTQAGAEVDQIDADEAALIAANQAEVDATEFQVPLLKLAQPLTEEVTAGNASAGDLVLPLTGQSFSGPVEFIVAGKGKGRFKPGKDGERTLTAYDQKLVPWKDDPFFGKPFSEHPDAEEQWRITHEDDWGSGPPIQTSFIYTGYIVGEPVPVRLSLRRTSAPAARKWDMLLDAVLRGRYWDKVFVLNTEQQKNKKGAYYTVTVELGRATTTEEKKQAITLAQALRNQSVTTVGEEGDSPTVEPDAKGGLEV